MTHALPPTPRLRTLLFVVPAVIAAIAVALLLLVVGPSQGHPMRLHAPDWGLIADQAPVLQLHIAAASLALAIGVVLLAGIKGNRLHRTLGWTWTGAMATVAISSFFIRDMNGGAFSWIHLLSGWTLIVLPMGLYAARRHEVAKHRGRMTGLFVGALLIAGLFTFMPGRLMWQVFLG